jgi:hypothetical protein
MLYVSAYTYAIFGYVKIYIRKNIKMEICSESLKEEY